MGERKRFFITPILLGMHGESTGQLLPSFFLSSLLFPSALVAAFAVWKEERRPLLPFSVGRRLHRRQPDKERGEREDPIFSHDHCFGRLLSRSGKEYFVSIEMMLKEAVVVPLLS